MASVPNPARKSAGAGTVIIVIAVIVIALALAAGHHHLAVPPGGGNAHVVPHLVGTPADPCHHQPDEKVVRTIRAPGRSRNGSVFLDCGEWRQILRRTVRRGTGGRATIRQILACIEAAVTRGDWARNAGSYAWQWGPGGDDIAVVMAGNNGRIGFTSPGGAPGARSWRDCAKAAR